LNFLLNKNSKLTLIRTAQNLKTSWRSKRARST